MVRGQEDQQQRRLLYELCTLALSILRSPSAVPLPPAPAEPPRLSPAGLASLLLGMSLALMVCGSLTFVIGFMLIPWLVGMVMVFYVAGLFSSLSVLGKSILCSDPASARSPRKRVAGKHCISTSQIQEEFCVWQ